MRTRTKEVETTDISRTPDYLQKLVSHIRLVRMKWIDNSRYFPMMLLMPVLIFFLVWNIIPLLWMLGMSFYNYSLLTGDPPFFIGIENYVDLYFSYSVWESIAKTFTFVVLSVGIETVLGIMLGILFWGSKSLPGRRFFLALLFFSNGLNSCCNRYILPFNLRTDFWNCKLFYKDCAWSRSKFFR